MHLRLFAIGIMFSEASMFLIFVFCLDWCLSSYCFRTLG